MGIRFLIIFFDMFPFRISISLLARSHCAIFSDCDCDLLLLIMGYIGTGEVVAVA